MSDARDILQLAIPFVWFGMAAAISLLETPLKFRAPGITLALGLGIGRLVFRALNLVELALLTALTATFAGDAPTGMMLVLVLSLWVLLPVQAFVLRPLLDRRAQAIIDGNVPPPSRTHHLYIILELVKLLALPTLGVLLTRSLP